MGSGRRGRVRSRDLKDADHWDEVTERHELPVIVNNQITMPSQPDSDPPPVLSEQPKKEYVSLLAKLLPPEHCIYFFSLVVVGNLLLALAKGWLHF